MLDVLQASKGCIAQHRFRPSDPSEQYPHSSSAIGDIASSTSSDGSSRSRLLSLLRASILPIRPRARAADAATPWSTASPVCAGTSSTVAPAPDGSPRTSRCQHMRGCRGIRSQLTIERTSISGRAKSVGSKLPTVETGDHPHFVSRPMWSGPLAVRSHCTRGATVLETRQQEQPLTLAFSRYGLDEKTGGHSRTLTGCTRTGSDDALRLPGFISSSSPHMRCVSFDY
jgi:hypothetical protein